MKSNFLRQCLLLFGILFLLWGCFKDPDGFTETKPARPQKLTLERARATHEAVRARATRSEGDFGILYSGNLDPWWDGARYSESDFSESFDVEVIAEKYYEQVHYITDSFAVRSTVFPRLVVVEERLRDRNPTSYVAFYFPDLLTEENYEQDAGEGLLNSLPKEGFSGVIVYTTLRGFPVAASRHKDGCQLSHAFLGNATDYASLLEEAEKYNRIVENIRIFVGEETRSVAEEVDITWLIISKEAAVITSDGQTPVFDVDSENKILPVDWHKLDLTGDGGSNPTTPTGITAPSDGIGDSEAGSNLKDGKYDKNDHIQTDNELVAEILDLLYEDCMGKTLIDAIDTDITIVVDVNKNSYDKNNRTIYFGEVGMYGGQRPSVMPFALMEELTHVFQRDRVDDDIFEDAKLNYEIEAKCGCLLRELRANNQDPMYLRNTRTYNLFLGRNGTTAFCEMIIDDIIQDENLPQEILDIYYEDAINSLRSIEEYRDEKKYPESYSERKFQHLIELMKNCPEL